MSLRVFNVLGREKVEFEPINPGRVTMYVCGPTVQDYSHLGHAKTYISFDVINRYLRYKGNDVLYVQNITDVGHLLDTGEDRIIKKAQQASGGNLAQPATVPMQIVEIYTKAYFDDMDALGIQRPDISPRASAHIPEQIEMIETLLKNENAYIAEDGVYFDVSSHEDYGKLSNRKREESETGKRTLKGRGKRNPEDFVLWVIAPKEHLLKWDSPWGRGYPGWHIECSAMSRKYLGETFDIHGGGIENIFPHNECECAQSEAANGKPFANHWLLTGSLTINGVKMSKSLGNFVRVRDALEKYRAEVIRTWVFQTHYSNPVDYSEDALAAAQKGWEGLMSAVRLTREALRSAPDSDAGSSIIPLLDKARADFIEAMDNDFNAPVALSVLQALTTEVNKLLNSGEVVGKTALEAIEALYNELGGQVLGIIPDVESTSGADAQRQDGLIRLLIDLRQQARAEKQFARSDQIRNQLKSLGVVLEDRADGTIYKLEH
jgi:cysteinyl-tRNA synthetase